MKLRLWWDTEMFLYFCKGIFFLGIFIVIAVFWIVMGTAISWFIFTIVLWRGLNLGFTFVKFVSYAITFAAFIEMYSPWYSWFSEKIGKIYGFSIAMFDTVVLYFFYWLTTVVILTNK